MQLRCFVAVAQDLSFRRAARRLNMTQPPLTRHIQALEHEVGAQLVDRSRRAIRLTPAGNTFAQSARRILDDATDAARQACRVAAGETGAVTIAFTAASSYALLPKVIMAIRAEAPKLVLELRELASPQQIDLLKGEQVDFCLMRPPLVLPGIATRRILREPLVLAVPRRHRLARKKAIELADLEHETLITYPPVEGPYLYGLAAGLLHAAGVQPHAVQYVTQTHSILALVEASIGVAIVPEAAAHVLPAGVTLRPIAGARTAHADLLLAWPTASNNPARRVVLEILKRRFPSTPAKRAVAEPD
jgi:DNA-binding transcriptional LysR family regulator